MSAKHHIIGFEAENIKKIKAISLNFGDTNGVVEVTGMNEQGKSTLLDTIEYAFAGKKSFGEMPIRLGETKAHIILKTETLTVKRTFTLREDGDYNTTLLVETNDGMRPPKPETFLSGLFGDISFDPIAFSRKEQKDQIEVLKAFVKDFDFADNAARRKKAFSARTEANREVTALKSRIASVVVPDGTLDQEIDTSDLMQELEDVGSFNMLLSQREERRAGTRRSVDIMRDNAEKKRADALDLRRQADDLDSSAEQLDNDANALQVQIDTAEPLPEPKDASKIRGEIDEANAANAHIRRKIGRTAMEGELTEAEKAVAELEAEIAEIDAEKAKAIKEAEIPVEGLEFGEESFTLDGIPFSQASYARKIRVGLQLAAAANQKLRVILIRDGAFLDKNSLATLATIAREMDFTIFVETVDSGRPGSIVIEDGSIKEIIPEE